MKKIFYLLFILLFSFMAAGCSTGKENRGEQTAYGEQGEEDAVNTVQMGSQYRVIGSMEELKNAVVRILGKDYWPDTLLSEEEMAERTGISSSMYENFMAEYQHTEAGIDMMILIEAKEDEIEKIEQYLNDYRDLLLKIYEQQPLNRSKVFASRIEVIDNYVCYVQLGADISSLANKDEEEMISYCQQQNERALDILEKTILNS